MEATKNSPEEEIPENIEEYNSDEDKSPGDIIYDSVLSTLSESEICDKDNSKKESKKDIIFETTEFTITNQELKTFLDKYFNKYFLLQKESFEHFKSLKLIIEHYFQNELYIFQYFADIKPFLKKKMMKNIYFEMAKEKFMSSLPDKYVKHFKKTMKNIENTSYKNIDDFLNDLLNKFCTNKMPQFIYNNLMMKCEFEYNIKHKINDIFNKENLKLYEGVEKSYNNYKSDNKNVLFCNWENRANLLTLFILSNIQESETKFKIFQENKEFLLLKFGISSDYNYNDELNRLHKLSKDEFDKEISSCVFILLYELNQTKNSIFNLIAQIYILIKLMIKLNDDEDNYLCYIVLCYNFLNYIQKDENFKKRYSLLFDLRKYIKYLECSEDKNSTKKNAYDNYDIETIFGLVNQSGNKILEDNLNLLVNKLNKYNFELPNILNKLEIPLKIVMHAVDLFSKKPKFHSLKLNHHSKKLKLIPLNDGVFGRSVTILISGYLSEADEHEFQWINLINKCDNFTMYYFYQWPSNSLMKAIIETVLFISKSKGIDLTFEKAIKRAIISGKILATILACKYIFKNCYINLVGFSLGCQVLYSCLEQLNKYNCTNIINNVTFLGGAVHIEGDYISAEIFKNTVNGRIINCYSSKDNILKILFQNSTYSCPIGYRRLEWKTDDPSREADYAKFNSMIENYDFSDLNLGHLQYRKKLDEIMQRINLV